MADFARLVLDADTKGLKRGRDELGRMSGKAKETARDIDVSSGKISKSFIAIGGAIASAVALTGGLGAVIRTNAEFGASMSKVAAISGATADELEQLRATALKMGADTAFSAAQAADALGFLAMAGFSASEAMEAIPDVLALAAASGMDLAEAADIASNVISGFGKEAKDAAQVADVLAVAASTTNTNVSQLGQALSTAAPIAAALGISMEETAAAIGVMSDAGIQGERAGTALRGIFASLAGPTTKAQEALAKYGLTAAQIDPQTVGLANAMALISERGVSTADAFVIFGREAASGALVMAETSQRMKELTGDFQNAEGAAQDMAAVMRDNLTGDIDELTGSLETMIITLGDAGVTGALRTMAQIGVTSINAVTENMRGLISIVTVAGSAWAAYRLTLMAANAVGVIATSTMAAQTGAAMAYTRSVGVMTAAKTAATVATRTLTGALIANPFTAVAVAVGALTAAMVGLGNAQRQARAETDNLVRSLRGLAQARSSEYGLRRAEVELEKQRTEAALEANMAEQRRIQTSPEFAQRSTAGSRVTSLQREEQRLRWQIVEMRGELSASAHAARQAEEAAESMIVPIAQGATAITSLGTAASGAGSAISDTTREIDRLGDVLNRVFPERANYARILEDFRTLDKELAEGAITEAQRARYRMGLLAANDNSERGLSFNTGPLEEARRVAEATDLLGLTTEELAKKLKFQTVEIADSFRTMSERVLGSLRNLTSSIQSGDFIGILSGVLELFLQLGSTGLFGSGIQTNINKPISGKRANGGQVNAGRSYLVGEKGPELFTPPGHGRIISNDNMGQQAVKVMVGIDPANGNVTAYVNGQIAATAPLIAQGGAQLAAANNSRMQKRRVR